MSMLNDMLQEEYDRCERMQAAIAKEQQVLPVGYLSQKNIKNKPYNYLQKRVGKKIVSTYIPEANVPEIKSQIERRRQLTKMLEVIEKNRKKIKRALKP